MFNSERIELVEKIRNFCIQEGYPFPEIQWNWIPFSGHWGISTSMFAIAAAEARQKKVKINVPEKAAEIADQLVVYLGIVEGFEKIEAVKGYLNLYFTQSDYAGRVIDSVIEQSIDYGRGNENNEQVMVEFSQPNTHKAFHVGHLRSAIMGDTIGTYPRFCRI